MEQENLQQSSVQAELSEKAELCENTVTDESVENAKNKSGKKKPRVASIGGQALMEGVMMRGKKSMAMAVRDPSGNIQLETKRLGGTAKWYNRVPIIRGVCAFASSLVSGVTTLMKSAEVSTPDEDTPSKGWMGFAVVMGVVFAVLLFIVLPWGLNYLIFDLWLDLKDIIWLTSLLEGVLRLLIFVLYLLIVSRLKDIRRTFMYHGAEHRTINCFEKGLELNVKNVQSCSTRHNRCGTTFLFFVMVLSILVFSVVNWVVSLFGIDNSTALAFTRLGLRLALLPLVAGLSYELLKGLALLPDNKFTNILRAPGLALQRLTTYPPTDDMAEVALTSFKAVMAMDEDASIEEVKFNEHNLKQVKDEICSVLQSVGGDGAEADWILCDVLKVKRNVLKGQKKIDAKTYKHIKQIMARRSTGEPLDYILGYSQFFGNKIIVSPAVLIPRLDTETVAESAIKIIGDRECSVLDLCTGSGCIAKALQKNTNAKITCSDVSDKALDIARQNVSNAEFVLSDMFDNLQNRKFDVIVCNPPYIESEVIPTLSIEVRCYEPLLALDGGRDGLNFYKRICAEASTYLEEKGSLVLEIGYNQAQSVKALLKDGFERIDVVKDMSGNDRAVTAIKKD